MTDRGAQKKGAVMRRPPEPRALRASRGFPAGRIRRTNAHRGRFDGSYGETGKPHEAPLRQIEGKWSTCLLSRGMFELAGRPPRPILLALPFILLIVYYATEAKRFTISTVYRRDPVCTRCTPAASAA